MFKQELKSLTERIPGANGALIMGLDGITVERFSSDDLVNLEALSAEYLSLVKKSVEMNQEFGIGRIQELSVTTARLTAVFMAVTEEYFLVLTVAANGGIGRARYELRKSALRLAGELS